MKYLTVSNVLLALSVIFFVANLAVGNILPALALFLSTGFVVYGKLSLREAKKVEATYLKELIK